MRAGGNRTGGDRPPGTDVDTLESLVAHSLRAEGFDASEDGTGRGTPLVPIAFDARQSDVIQYGDKTGPLDTDGHTMAVAYGLRSDAGREGSARTPSADAEGRIRLRDPGFNIYEGFSPTLDASQPHAVAYDILGVPATRGAVETDVHVALRARLPGQSEASTTTVINQNWVVRRLTPRECERVQGFPDNYTAIPKAADGPRYKALGNSMAVNVMRWIGRRIELTSQLSSHHRQTQQGE